MATSGCLQARAPSAWQCANAREAPRAHRRCHATKIHCAVATQEVCTGVKRNANFAKLQAGYLFPEIAKRRREHQEANPDARIISLGIGDTTEPIPQVIADAMANAAAGMATREGYSGYGAEQGKGPLREAICEKLYKGMGLKPSDIFVSDGSKCDIGRLQGQPLQDKFHKDKAVTPYTSVHKQLCYVMMLGSGSSVAVQDPSYPVYVDSSVIMGMTGDYNQEATNFGNVQYMPCTPDNGFFPDISVAEKSDIIFFCSPNNPTGAAASREQLKHLVDTARKNGSIIIYDAAYALYIEDDNCPKSIFEIPGADEVAIETCSFSKYAGFTGVRLGWTVVPAALKFADGTPVQQDFNRIMTTTFNGASVISQAGGLACMQDKGYQAMLDLVSYYKENASILRKTFKDMGFSVYGGENAPYVWVGFPGQPSWDVFADILHKCNIVTTPGSGFGPAGEGFVRASAFGHREDIMEAVERFKSAYGN